MARSPVSGVWSLDIMLALAILALLNGLALHAHLPTLFKARLTQSMLALADPRLVLAEHFAMTGEWLDSDVGLQGDVVDAGRDRDRSGGGDLEDMALSGKLSGRPADAGKGKGGDEGRAGAARSGTTTTGIVEGVIVVLGNYRGFDGVTLLSLRPAVLDGAEQPTVRWLCGRKATPRGWESPLVTGAANLPDELLLSVCRDGQPQ